MSVYTLQAIIPVDITLHTYTVLEVHEKLVLLLSMIVLNTSVKID